MKSGLQISLRSNVKRQINLNTRVYYKNSLGFKRVRSQLVRMTCEIPIEINVIDPSEPLCYQKFAEKVQQLQPFAGAFPVHRHHQVGFALAPIGGENKVSIIR